jgi:hypothetical protein
MTLGAWVGLYPIVTFQYSSTLYTSFPIIFSSCFSKVTVVYDPRCAGCAAAHDGAVKFSGEQACSHGRYRHFHAHMLVLYAESLMKYRGGGDENDLTARDYRRARTAR